MAEVNVCLKRVRKFSSQIVSWINQRRQSGYHRISLLSFLVKLASKAHMVVKPNFGRVIGSKDCLQNIKRYQLWGMKRMEYWEFQVQARYPLQRNSFARETKTSTVPSTKNGEVSKTFLFLLLSKYDWSLVAGRVEKNQSLLRGSLLKVSG